MIPFVRNIVSWTLLAAMLVSMPGGTAGRFVCMLGMAEAGPACPHCHGQANAERPGGGIENRCCKFVAGQSAMDCRLLVSAAERPAPAREPMLPIDAGHGLSMPPDRDQTARGNHRRPARPPTSGYLSNFLRL